MLSEIGTFLEMQKPSFAELAEVYEMRENLNRRVPPKSIIGET